MLASTLFAGGALAADYKIIVNQSNSVTAIAKKDLSAMFLKKTATWTNGSAIVTVDQIGTAPVRTAFTQMCTARPRPQ